MLAWALEVFRSCGKNLEQPVFPPTGGGGLAVSIFAVENTIDPEGVFLFAEEDGMVPGAKADQGRGYALGLLGGSFAGEDVASEGLEDLDGDRLLDRANVGLCLIGPDDAFGHAGLWFAAHLLPAGQGEAELGEHLLVRDGGVVLGPFAGRGDGFGFSGAECVAVFNAVCWGLIGRPVCELCLRAC